MKTMWVAGTIVGLVIVGAALVLAEPFASVNDSGYTLQVTHIKSLREHFMGGGKDKSTVEFQGKLKLTRDADVVAVKRYLSPSSVVDASSNDLLDLNSAANSTPKYSAILPTGADVELLKADLHKNSFLIQKMRVHTEAVIAKTRDKKVFPAIVMEEFKPAVDGLLIRITKLAMSPGRELAVTVAYQRGEAGTRRPFLEAVYALDTDGADIGGERWTAGDPFGAKGEATYKFQLKGTQVHQSFRLVTVTENTTEGVDFDVTGVFQE